MKSTFRFLLVLSCISSFAVNVQAQSIEATAQNNTTQVKVTPAPDAPPPLESGAPHQVGRPATACLVEYGDGTWSQEFLSDHAYSRAHYTARATMIGIYDDDDNRAVTTVTTAVNCTENQTASPSMDPVLSENQFVQITPNAFDIRVEDGKMVAVLTYRLPKTSNSGLLSLFYNVKGDPEAFKLNLNQIRTYHSESLISTNQLNTNEARFVQGIQSQYDASLNWRITDNKNEYHVFIDMDYSDQIEAIESKLTRLLLTLYTDQQMDKSELELGIGHAHDPNGIKVSTNCVSPSQVQTSNKLLHNVKSKTLHYVVQFENNGNVAANTVQLKVKFNGMQVRGPQDIKIKVGNRYLRTNDYTVSSAARMLGGTTPATPIDSFTITINQAALLGRRANQRGTRQGSTGLLSFAVVVAVNDAMFSNEQNLKAQAAITFNRESPMLTNTVSTAFKRKCKPVPKKK